MEKSSQIQVRPGTFGVRSPFRTESVPISLPLDLLEESSRRLGLTCLTYALIYTLNVGLELWIQDLQLGEEGYIAGASVGLSLAFFAMTRASLFSPSFLLSVSVFYEALGALGIALLPFWSGEMPASGTSWICVWILLFPVVVPSPPGRALIAAVLSASMEPFALVLALKWGPPLSLPSGPLSEMALHLFLPNYICAGLATFASQVIYKLGTDVTAARRMGSYQLEEKLGHGGMGEVWKARHRMLARPAAIKLMRPEALNGTGATSRTAWMRFEREAQATATLSSPHTIELYDFGKTESGMLYYVMEYLEGRDLQELIERHGPIPGARAVYILEQALASVGEAHRRGILHRDIKPGNLFLTERGGDLDYIKVLDFGLAQDVRSEIGREGLLSMEGSLAGTPLYMAPERFYGPETADHRADLYALGAVGYFMLTGQPVFEGLNPVQILVEHARTRPRSLRELGATVSPQLEAVILKALEKDPDKRFATAEEFHAGLNKTPEQGQWSPEAAWRWWWENVF